MSQQNIESNLENVSGGNIRLLSDGTWAVYGKSGKCLERGIKTKNEAIRRDKELNGKSANRLSVH